MRGLFAGVLLSLALATPALGETWTAEDSRLTFNTPDGWTATRAPITSRTYVVAREGERQCHVLTMDRPGTADHPAADVRVASRTPLATSTWERIPASMPRVFGENARLVSSRVDDTAYWPIHFGRYQSTERVVHAAVQFRPGIEFWAFCYSDLTGLADDGGAYDSLFRSIAATNDEELVVQVDQLERSRQAELRRRHGQAVSDHERATEQFSSANVTGAMSTNGAPTP